MTDNTSPNQRKARPMTTAPSTLAPIPDLAAQYLEAPDHHWITGRMDDGQGGVCLHGAIRQCSPRRGDAELVRALARKQGFTENWNDTKAADVEEVAAALRTVDTSDTAIRAAFGPQGLHVVALVQAAGNLTTDQARTLRRERFAYAAAAAAAAAYAAAYAAAAAAYAAAYAAAAAAAYAYAGAGAAARALSIRHLIGKHGFTQEHYDTLTGPWRRVVGPVHPDDADLKANQ